MLAHPDPQPGAREVSHNLLGQRLGRKGQETRERILAAALRLLEAPGEGAITLTAMAREASVGMTTLYLYFPDLGDLVLAALMRVMDSADDAFIDKLRTRWPDEALAASCLEFLRAHHRFWQQHARILHLRNSFADANDIRFLAYRNDVSRPLLGLLVRQMDGADDLRSDDAFLATVLLTVFERLATVVTNDTWHFTARDFPAAEAHCYVDRLLQAEAELIARAIAERRRAAARH